ncbi:unnamed protein product [Rotaria sp. Silwood2]|nr:unnamed protein product [Rotaria sp. Silwood2]CAF2728722.1 unnamed protein product [Rotaria sp. Silwood2]CAF3189371.1 unnamed protein product [Rotaria sp. Silwood2]CAF3869379.1 unnamed protein product [Rotaria sp. Silwood2]CAF4054975.1 unnamed protein product [Rotaria sp. Silwood2]
MYSALIGAHTAMDRIQLNVQQVPGHVKTALKLVIAGSPLLIQVMLPKTLETIGRIATESAGHAQTTFNKFVALQDLVAEIIEANVNTHSTQSDVVAQIQAQINAAKQEQLQFNANINSITAQYEDARKEVEKARKEYQEAYNAIPTFRGWFKSIFRKIINVVVKIITAPLRILGCILGKCYTNQNALNEAAETAKQNAKAKAAELLKVLQEAERRQQEFAQQQLAEQQKLVTIINRIAALDLDRLTEQEIVDILIESILQMNQIKEQWGRLIQFFSKLSVQADSTQQARKIVIHEFIAAIKEAQANNLLLDPSDRELFLELITITSQEIERGAHLLYVMSKTYFDVSSEYMIDQIIASGNLLLLQTDTERSNYLRSLSQNTTSTTTRVKNLAHERHQEYIARNQARRTEYERFLAKLALEDLESNVG